MKNELLPLQKMLEKLHTHTDIYTVMSDFFAITACQISRAVDTVTAAERTAFLKDVNKKYSENELSIFSEAFGEVLRVFDTYGLRDWLGELYMYSNTSSKQAGQFFTPYDVSKMCAECAACDAVERINAGESVITVSEPACGSGGMILAFCDVLHKSGINYCEHVIADCSDIDLRCIHMTYVQLSIAGIPAVIRRQNTLTLEQYGNEWHTPALIFNWMKFGRYVRRS